MSDHGSDGTVEDPTAHPDYGALIDAPPASMDMLTSGFGAEREPVGTLFRSLYDMDHCGSCDDWRGNNETDWKRVHICEREACRRDYWNRTCRYEREEFLRFQDLACPPEYFFSFVDQQFNQQPQYPDVEFQTDAAVNLYPSIIQSELQLGAANANPNFPEYAEEQQYQQPVPDANWINSPSSLPGTPADTGGLDRQYNPQEWLEMFTNIPSYTGDSSTISAPYNTFDHLDTQEWTLSYPSATYGQHQDEDNTNNRRGSASDQHGSRTDRQTDQ